jgi:hypothetical protein
VLRGGVERFTSLYKEGSEGLVVPTDAPDTWNTAPPAPAPAPPAETKEG